MRLPAVRHYEEDESEGVTESKGSGVHRTTLDLSTLDLETTCLNESACGER